MLETHLRQAATVLLEWTIRIAPPDARNWGQAMRGELNYVEGHWAAIVWALGGAGLLAKHALAALFMPGRRRQGIPTGPGLFARNVSVRKAMLVAGGACVVGASLFLAAPPFRQALRVATLPWTRVFQSGSTYGQPRLWDLAKRAEQRRDAEGLAFCAVRLEEDAASARLAKEAVGLDPNLLWVYAVVAVRHPELGEIAEWVPELERWDPPNAFFPLITAESIDINRIAPGEIKTRAGGESPEWRRAMTAAFESAKFDDYLNRAEELDRNVVARYRFNDPEEVLFQEDSSDGLPTYAGQDSRRFAASLIKSGEELEARGERTSAGYKYWAVSRFGQMIDSQGHTGSEHRIGTSLQALAYNKLQALALSSGNDREASLFGYLAGKFGPASAKHDRAGEWVFGKDTFGRNAWALVVSGQMLLIFSGLLVVAAVILLAASRRGARAAARAKPVATLLAMASAMGLLLSASVLYLTYRPYWYMFQSALLNGDRTQARDLRAFLDSTHVVFGFQPYPSAEYRFYFWAGVILLGFIGLILILLRHFRGGARADGLQHSPRVP